MKKKNLFILTGIGVLLIIGILNYSGFCFKKLHYLSDNEKIRMAIAAINKKETKTFFNTKLTPFKYRISIPYHDVDSFLSKNPDCCSVVPYAGFESVTDEPVPPSFFERICGRYNSAVRIQYTYLYLEGPIDEDGNKGPVQQYTENRIGDFHMNNCGESTTTWLNEISDMHGTFYMKKDWNK
ncbi:hypothetical protein [Desulfobacter sp.]|uniref:hypothetical protein n=1 Tax=Desulfobacter sp. TaxID=2294 RepID=UPI000E93906C|nr:hypothetical protein [Desulfobacter sp.]HBT87318.1 hypothetical protein [Desulfobacter sp.]